MPTRSGRRPGNRRPACTRDSERPPDVRPIPSALDGAAHRLGLHRAGGEGLALQRAPVGRLHPAGRRSLPAPRVRGRARDPLRRGGRAAHPDGPEHRRRLAGRGPDDRAQDDPDARRARRPQALHRRPGRGLQRRMVPGAEGPPVVRRVPAGLGARPRPSPPLRVPGRASRRGLQHERRVQPRGDPAAERAVVPRRDGRRGGLAAGVRGHRGPALPSDPRDRDPDPDLRHRDAVHDARVPPRRDRGDHPLPARGARPPHVGEMQPDPPGRRPGPGHRHRRPRVRRRADPRRSLWPRPDLGGRDPDVRAAPGGRRRRRARLRPQALEHAGGAELARRVRPGPHDVPVGPRPARRHGEPRLGDHRGARRRSAAVLRRRRRLLQRRRPAGRGHAHDHRLLRPPEVGWLPADAAIPGARGRRLRRGGGRPHRRPHPPDRRRRRLRGRPCRRRGLRELQPARLRRPGRARLALPQGRLPHGPLQDAAPAGPVRLHRGALSRRVPGRPAGAGVHARRSRRRSRRGRPHHPDGQPAAFDPGAGLRSPVREHVHPDAPGPAARDPPDQALHHGAGGRSRAARGAAPRRPPRRDHRRRAGRPGRGRVAGARRDRRDDLRGAPVRGWDGGRGDPGLPAAAGADRPGRRGPRAARRRDPLRRPGGDRRHGRVTQRRRVLCGLRRGRRPAREAARPARGGCRGRHRRRDVPAGRPRGPTRRGGAARGRRRRGRHGDGLRPLGASRRGLVCRPRLPPHDRPDAGRPRGDPRPPRGGDRDRRAGPPCRPPRRGRPACRRGLRPYGVPRRARRLRPQGPLRRPGLRVRDRGGHPRPRDQPAPGPRRLRGSAAEAHAGRLRRRGPGDVRDVDPGRLRRRRCGGPGPRVDREGGRGRQAGRRRHRGQPGRRRVG